jgi:hypothetical protein
MADRNAVMQVPEDVTRLASVGHKKGEIDVDAILELLRQDFAVLVSNVGAAESDGVMRKLAGKLGLGESLELQAGFAGSQGRRHRVGEYFMSVNKRSDYQFVPPHSEGSSFVGMELSAFFCYENTTDGGVTILMNVVDSSDVWCSLREEVNRGRIGSRPLRPQELSRIRFLHQLNLPADVLKDDDEILEEYPADIPDLTLVRVLAKPTKTYSRILERKLYVLWTTISSIDSDCSTQYAHLLRSCGLLKQPETSLELHKMADSFCKQIWHSGVDYSQVFKCKVTRKLAPGDLLIQNNLTWTHSSSNWSPGCGTRRVAASFA